jgi:hypothetical protein
MEPTPKRLAMPRTPSPVRLRSFRTASSQVLGFLSELHALHVDLFLRQQGLDTTTPAGKAMFQMMRVFTEFKRAMIAEGSEDAFSASCGRVDRLHDAVESSSTVNLLHPGMMFSSTFSDAGVLDRMRWIVAMAVPAETQ